MRIWQMTVEADKVKEGPTVEDYRKASEVIREQIRQETSIEVNGLQRVDYDTKTDRYVATFGTSKVLKLHVTNRVAEFLATNLMAYGAWYVKMEDGLVTDANLVQAG